MAALGGRQPAPHRIKYQTRRSSITKRIRTNEKKRCLGQAIMNYHCVSTKSVKLKKRFSLFKKKPVEYCLCRNISDENIATQRQVQRRLRLPRLSDLQHQLHRAGDIFYRRFVIYTVNVLCSCIRYLNLRPIIFSSAGSVRLSLIRPYRLSKCFAAAICREKAGTVCLF